MIELPDAAIDRASPVPFYFQLAKILEQKIVTGRWPSGEQLPSEPQMCKHYSVSRTTIRQALARLERRSLISRQAGRGTFVESTQPGLWLLQASEGFFQVEVDRSGRTVSSRIIRSERAPLPDWACTALQLPASSNGATLERLRSIDGLVALYVVNHLPERIADAALSIVNPDESLYRRLKEQEGIEASGGRRTVAAVAAEEWIAELLDVASGTPVAFIESVSWDGDFYLFDCYRAWLRTDRLRIDVQVGSPLPGDDPVALSPADVLVQ